MGVTIHFDGQLKNEAAYKDLVKIVSSVAKSEEWQTEPIESGEVTLLRVRDEKDWDYVGPVKGIVVYLHDDCDPVRFEFEINARGLRRTTKQTGLDRKTIRAILRGMKVKISTLAKVVMGFREQQERST